MIDGHFKHVLDKGWDRLGALIAATGISANAVTWTGLGLMLLLCVAYAWIHNQILFAIGLALVFAFDSLDGAVARASKTQSLYGGYLDAVVDRYQEIAVLAVLGHVHGAWPEAFFAITGALVISYNKARTAVEIPIENAAWPDFFERLERVLFLSLGMLAIGIVAHTDLRDILGGADQQVAWLLAVFALVAYATSIQRFCRARAMLRAADKER